MHSTTLFAVIAFAATSLASPVLPIGALDGIGGVIPVFPAPQDVTVAQAAQTCGKDLELSCCDDTNLSVDSSTKAAGALGLDVKDILGKVGIFGKCNTITVPVVNLIPVNNLLNNQCKQNVACCQGSGTQQSGALNAGLPCIGLSSLI
ncbi:Hydrophobin [Arthrobotrys entomopaga]|nr:Hydrophobin [Arthrobotrys entomopaga]